jgi:hypothetical protein
MVLQLACLLEDADNDCVWKAVKVGSGHGIASGTWNRHGSTVKKVFCRNRKYFHNRIHIVLGRVYYMMVMLGEILREVSDGSLCW